MALLDIAHANVATAALERCLRIVHAGRYCWRLTHLRPRSRVRIGIGFSRVMEFMIVGFIGVLLTFVWAVSHFG